MKDENFPSLVHADPMRTGGLRGARMKEIIAILIFVMMVMGASVSADTTSVLNHVTPVFALTDTEGKKRTLQEFQGRPVLLCFYCGCQACQDCGREWSQMQRSGVLADIAKQNNPKSTGTIENPKSKASAPVPGIQNHSPITLIVYMGDKDATRAFAETTGLDLKQTVLLPDADYSVTNSYQALPCPRYYILDSKGLLRYVNNHADDAPQKAPASTIISHVIDALRQCDTPVLAKTVKRAARIHKRKNR